MASKKKAQVDRKSCVACGTCISVCPMRAIDVMKGCYARADERICVGCGKCAKVCPTGCISIAERGEHA